MKLCWETIDHLVLLDYGRLRYYENTEELSGVIPGNFDISENQCLYCGNYFLSNTDKKEKFCDKECKKKYNFEKNAYKKVTIDKRLKENGGGWHVKYTKHKKGHPAWNKGIKIIGDNTSFNVYKDRLAWFVEVRPDPLNGIVLQTKCCICNKWFSPDKATIKRVINFANGEYTKKNAWGFYCSQECKDKCPYFGKSIKTALKNYTGTYSEIHRISKSVLYYDWQEELKKTLKPENHKYKKRELRRRKKRTRELENIRRRKEKKDKIKKRELYLKSCEGMKETRLKRNLYLSKQRSKKLNMKHDLDYNWLLENTPDKCPKCGIPLDYDMNIKMNPFAPSIDRIDSNKGYTKDNCIMVSWMYNCGKNCYTEETLYTVCKAFINNSIVYRNIV